jgi:DNA-binding transcriptional MerR regulator
METTRGLTVSDLARLSGVTVRTLHHYDAIGLLVPSDRSHAGYRNYSPADAERLAHIVAYRACGLSLAEIADVLDADGATAEVHLRRQLELLDRRLQDTAEQRRVLITALEARIMGINLDPTEILEVFGDHDPTEHAAEAEERWGETDAYRESHRRTSQYTKADWEHVRAESEAIEAELAGCLAGGEPADGSRARAVAERHRGHIDTWYYPCSYEIHVGLADMYVADPRFTAHYDDRMPGLAAYVRDAIYANALTH